MKCEVEFSNTKCLQGLEGGVLSTMGVAGLEGGS